VSAKVRNKPTPAGLPVVVIGFGGHGQVVADALRACGRELIAVTELAPEQCAPSKMQVEIIRDDEVLKRFTPESVELALGLGSIWPVDANAIRRRVVNSFVSLGYRFTGFRHPAAWISEYASIAPTAQVHAGAVVQTGASIGEHCIINTRASIDHDGVIDRYCHIGPGVTLSGNVHLGEGTHVGTGACVIQGITMGKECFVAAGATVVKSVHDGVFLKGTPAKAFISKSAS
jgi:UDP-perosamine 4-acetyltransferase